MNNTPIKVLIIEDNPGDARLVEEMLIRASSATRFELAHVGRIGEGLALLAEGRFDVVLLDLSLPDGHGLDTIVRFRAGCQQLPIVVMSGLGDEELAVSAVQSGAQDYLVKGRVDGDLLVRSIRYAIERKRVESERDQLMAQLKEVNQRLVVTSLDAKEQAELAQGQAAELDATITSVADALVIFGPEGEIVRMNPAAENILGFSVAERGRPEAELGSITIETPEGEPVPFAELPYCRALRGETVRNVVMSLRRSNGRPMRVSVSAAPIRTPDGRLLGAVTTFTDITAVHELQVRLQDFIHMVSHDLRNPLTIIKGHSQLLQRVMERAGQTGVERRSVESIVTASRRMNAMIEDMVDAARSESGQLHLNRRPMDLKAFLDDLLEQASGVIDTGRLQTKTQAELPAISADPDRLERILINLLTNAQKYSHPETGVLLEVACTNEGLTFSVADRGVGIAAEDLSHIFERFYRAKGATKAEGLGLGLYITKMMVEAHGGRIWAESAPGEGSTFRFTLPLG